MDDTSDRENLCKNITTPIDAAFDNTSVFHSLTREVRCVCLAAYRSCN